MRLRFRGGDMVPRPPQSFGASGATAQRFGRGRLAGQGPEAQGVVRFRCVGGEAKHCQTPGGRGKNTMLLSLASGAWSVYALPTEGPAFALGIVLWVFVPVDDMSKALLAQLSELCRRWLAKRDRAVLGACDVAEGSEASRGKPRQLVEAPGRRQRQPETARQGCLSKVSASCVRRDQPRW